MGKKLTWLVVIIIVLLGAWWLLSPHAAAPQGGVATTTTSTIIPGVADETYTNSHLSFSIKYPATATSSAFDFSGYLQRTGTPVVSFVLPKEQGTNLSEAGVYIGATTTPSAMQSCENEVQQNGEVAVGTTTINGQDFATFTSSDAGAGNFYESTSLRTYQNGSCFEIVELIHSTNIGNYTPGTVVAFDHAKYQGFLEAIVATYYPIPTGI